MGSSAIYSAARSSNRLRHRAIIGLSKNAPRIGIGRRTPAWPYGVFVTHCRLEA